MILTGLSLSLSLALSLSFSCELNKWLSQLLFSFKEKKDSFPRDIHASPYLFKDFQTREFL